MKRKFKKLWRWLAVFAVLFAIATGFQKNSGQSSEASTNSIAKIFNQFSQFSSQNTSHSQQLPAPTEDEAKVVLTSAVRNQLPASLRWNGHGAYIVNNNHPQLNAQISSAPYAVNHVDAKGRAWRGHAWLNRSTRQYQSREQTGNGATNWRPAGFLQATNLTNGPRHAYDRGHLLGYALVGGIKGFNASESNPQNIATQTAWANEARSSNSTGQNYYEGLVRKALDQNKQVRYRVTNIYDGNCVVPAGAHIEALSKDGSLSFNVFIPNVQNNIEINYATGAVRQR
ncbi:MAG TPA: DNA/RNA non-specific endonuclease [Candidatus Limosilactobacillus excrementigallinarum]|nr:DNA/RNA non-specific endonuclease [Candidatus Limosilactobacillus excrementigallinarum]